MKKVERHAPPEALVDLSEGLPVEAAVRQHVDACEVCSSQVEELRSALALARQTQPSEPEAGYWEGFVPRLRSRIASEEVRKRRQLPRWTWLASAAAVAALASLGFLFRDVVLAPDTGSLALEQTILPPAAEDEDFQVLVAMADLVDPEEDWESLGAELTSRIDLSSLSLEEQHLLLQRLRQALEENGDAKS